MATCQLKNCLYGENGLLFSPGRSDELAHHLDTLLQDEALRTCMGQESLRIIARHKSEDVLTRWEELYASKEGVIN